MVSMKEYPSTTTPIESTRELHLFPQAYLVARKQQQNVGRLKLQHLCEENAAHHYINQLYLTVVYRSHPKLLPNIRSSNSYLLALSDASSDASLYGQTCY
eukprot:IDg10601t1